MDGQSGPRCSECDSKIKSEWGAECGLCYSCLSDASRGEAADG